MTPTHILVGCGAVKLSRPAPASELYIGSLTRSAMQHARTSGQRWGIVSAHYGLLAPDDVVDPYERRLPPRSKLDARLALAQRIHITLAEWRWPRGTLELHMGDDYVDVVRYVAATGDWHITAPLAGLQVGERLAWYRQRRCAADG